MKSESGERNVSESSSWFALWCASSRASLTRKADFSSLQLRAATSGACNDEEERNFLAISASMVWVSVAYVRWALIMSSGLPAGVPISVCVCQRRKKLWKKEITFWIFFLLPVLSSCCYFYGRILSAERGEETWKHFRSDSTGGFLCVGARSMTTLMDRVEASWIHSFLFILYIVRQK